jgi:hypothetical protein
VEQLRQLCGAVHPYMLTFPIAERYGEIRRELRPPRGPGLIGDLDTLLAATAIQHNLTVITTDNDFSRVPNLKVRHIPRTDCFVASLETGTAYAGCSSAPPPRRGSIPAKSPSSHDTNSWLATKIEL